MVKANKKLLHASIAGAVIFVVGLIMAFVGFPLIVDDQIHRQVKLENGSDSYERWRQLPVPLDFKVYMFNITNWREVNFEGEYPNVEEFGPYYYRQYREKINIEYNSDEDSLTYKQFTHFEFDKEASAPLSESDKLVVLNAPLNAIFHVGSIYFPEILMSLLVDKFWISMFPYALDDSMFLEVEVGDFLFNGYTFCEPERWYGSSGLMCILAALLDIPFIEVQEDFSMKFSVFRFKHDTHDGIFTINAGNHDVTKLGQIMQWNGYAYNTIWGDRMSQCNKIRGTDGTVYPPDIKKEDEMVIFATEICRTVRLQYSGDETVTGVKAQKRVFSWHTLADPELYSDNQCYCGKHERDLYGKKKCLPNGFLDLSPCYIAPLIASFPHFLDADEEYQKTVTGFNRSDEAHRPVLYVEPMSGIPITAQIRLQFNMILRPIKGITVTKDIKNNMCPVAWIEMGAILPEDLVGEFRSLLNLAVVGVEVVKWLIVAIGACMFIICGGIQVRLKNGTDQYDRWKQLPVGIEFKIYLFHVKNWREVTFEGAKPEVEEKGPYVYKEFRRKENITYDEAEDSLTYIQYTRFEFDEELSGDLREDDKVVTLNAGLNAIFQVANRYFPEILMKALVDNSWQYMFPDVLEGSVFHEVSAGDILFKGYRFCDPENWNSVAGKQDKHDGVFTVNAGIKDVSKIGLITQWNGYAYNTIWKDRMSSCNKIKGRDGTIYAPDMQKEDVIDVFSTEICRTGVAAYDGEDKVSGITVQRRVLGADTLGDPETYPNNYCYCGKHERDLYGNKKCLPDGFSDLSPCYMAPVIASYPHFLFGDQKYAETVIGLDPVPEKHQTVLMVEPLTGTPMSGRKRLQFNMILRPVPGITVLENIVPNVCPIAWVEEGMLVPDDLLNTFKTLLHVALTAVDVIKWLITAIGACLLVGCGGRYYYKLKKYGPKE
nr:sensory neuron membrane protein 2-like [Onthophagus taurus]